MCGAGTSKTGFIPPFNLVGELVNGKVIYLHCDRSEACILILSGITYVLSFTSEYVLIVITRATVSWQQQQSFFPCKYLAQGLVVLSLSTAALRRVSW